MMPPQDECCFEIGAVKDMEGRGISNSTIKHKLKWGQNNLATACPRLRPNNTSGGEGPSEMHILEQQPTNR